MVAPDTEWANATFHKRIEMAIMQLVILDRTRAGATTRENIRQAFTGALSMEGDHLDHCLTQLSMEGHIKRDGGNISITDSGREAIQKVQPLVMELASLYAGGGGGGARRTPPPGQREQVR